MSTQKVKFYENGVQYKIKQNRGDNDLGQWLFVLTLMAPFVLLYYIVKMLFTKKKINKSK